MRFEVVWNVTNTCLTVAIEGSSKTRVSIDNAYREGSTFRIGKIISFFIEYIGERADIGEFITLSVHLVDNTLSYEGLDPENHLVSNGSELTGYLKRVVMNEECFPHYLSNFKYTSMNRLLVLERIHTKYVWLF